MRFFISLFVKVIPEPLIDEIPLLIFLPIISRHVSRQNLLSISLGSLFINPPNCTILDNQVFENSILAD